MTQKYTYYMVPFILISEKAKLERNEMSVVARDYSDQKYVLQRGMSHWKVTENLSHMYIKNVFLNLHSLQIRVPNFSCEAFYTSKSETVILTYSMLYFWIYLTKLDEVLD